MDTCEGSTQCWIMGPPLGVQERQLRAAPDGLIPALSRTLLLHTHATASLHGPVPVLS